MSAHLAAWESLRGQVCCIEEAAEILGLSTEHLARELREAGLTGVSVTRAGVRQGLLRSYLDWVVDRRERMLTPSERRLPYDVQAKLIRVPVDDLRRAVARARKSGAAVGRYEVRDPAAVLEDYAELLEQGLSPRDAAGRCGVSLRTIQRMKKRSER